MKYLILLLAVLTSFSAFSISIDFGEYEGTNLEKMSVVAVQEQCPALFNDGKLLKFISKVNSTESDEQIIEISLFGWRNRVLRG